MKQLRYTTLPKTTSHRSCYTLSTKLIFYLYKSAHYDEAGSKIFLYSRNINVTGAATYNLQPLIKHHLTTGCRAEHIWSPNEAFGKDFI